MQKDIIPKDKFSDIRKRAEEILAAETEDVFKDLSPEETRMLIHELNVHQTELEMQNDELRRTQLELEQARDRYIDLYDYAPIGYLIINDKAIIMHANLTSATMLGLERNILIGKPFSHFVSRDTQDAYYFFLQDIIKTETRQVCELKIKKKGDVGFYAYSDGLPILDADANVSQIRLSLNNIDERKRAEEVLKESEELHRVTLSNISDAVFITDETGAFGFICPNLSAIFGYSHEEIAAKGNIAELLGHGFFDVDELQTTGEIRNIECEVKDKSSVKHVLLVNVKQVSLKQGSILYTCRDITERKEVEKALRRSYDELETRVAKRTSELSESNTLLKQENTQRKQAEKHLLQSQSMLQDVFDGILDPLILMDSDLRIKLINRAAANYYGLADTDSVIDQICHMSFSGKSDPCEGCQVPLAVLKNEDMIFERKGFKDSHRFEEVVVYPLDKESGEPSDIILRLSDITERKLFEKQLIQSEKMASLGILISSIAHEINNPNSFVSFNIPILRDYVENMMPIVKDYAEAHPDFELLHMPHTEFHEDIFKLLENIEHGSARINTFVSNLREFSQIKHKSRRNWVDPASVVEKVLSICRVKVKKTVKSLTVDIPEDFPQIHTDPYSLEHILVNLLVNAAQAADKEDSCIKLSMANGDTWLEHTIIEVADNGCGIAESSIKHIFDPFFSTKSIDEGTGLGLYVCHDLVEGLGGSIEVESELGKYSTFRVILPDIERRSKRRG